MVYMVCVLDGMDVVCMCVVEGLHGLCSGCGVHGV